MKVKRVKKSKKRITKVESRRSSMLEFEVRKNGGKNEKKNELINKIERKIRNTIYISHLILLNIHLIFNFSSI